MYEIAGKKIPGTFGAWRVAVKALPRCRRLYGSRAERFGKNLGLRVII
jgi:hypothetical protein